MASLVVVLAVLGVWWLNLSHKITTLKTQITALQQKKASYLPILNQIAKLKKDKATLEKKVDALIAISRRMKVTPIELFQLIETRWKENS